MKFPLAKCLLISILFVAGIGATQSAQNKAQTLKERISAYADSQCKGKDGEEATKCRLENLWNGTQCDPAVLEKQAKMVTGEGNPCLIRRGEFAFDIVSIKPHKDVAGDTRNSGTAGPLLDGYRQQNMPIYALVHGAFNPFSEQEMEITGGPVWLTEDRYDFEGKYAPDVADAILKLGRDDYGFVQSYMLQQVLKDRMNFAAHIESKDVPAYDLVIGKNGPKLKDADRTAPDIGDVVSHAVPGKQGMILTTAKGVNTRFLAHMISRPAGRPVFDKTGLMGMYDITLEYGRQQALSGTVPVGNATGIGTISAPDPSGPSIFEAVGSLGLKLVPSRGPMTVVVIDRIEKPSGN
jgi:uncharacterized protein (TIGR03435 family)